MMKVRPLRCSGSGPSLTAPACRSHVSVGVEMVENAPVTVYGSLIRAITKFCVEVQALAIR
jgi:hypothetical protein